MAKQKQKTKRKFSHKHTTHKTKYWETRIPLKNGG